MRPRSRASFAACLLLALPVACAEDGASEVTAAGFARSLSLEPAAPPPSPREPRLVERHAPPAELAPWRVAAGTARVGGHPSGLESGLYLLGAVDKEVLVPGPFDPREFNQVVLTLIAKLRSSVRVELRRAGGSGSRSVDLPLLSLARPQRVVAGFAANELEVEPFDSLVITFPRRAGPIFLAAVDRVLMPLDSWLGEELGTRPVEIAGETRPARPLRSGVPLEARFEVPSGGVLDLSFAPVPELRFPGQEARLCLRVEGAGRARTEQRTPLPGRARETATWGFVRLALDGLPAGASARLLVELEAAGDRPAWAWIGEPRLARPRSDPPTVLLVTSDTHRGDHLGAARSGVSVRTPTLDALAERGLLFERAFSSTEITVPSHVALLTGVHPRDTRVLANFSGISERAHTLAEAFRSAGWRTFASVSARQLGHPISGLGLGFERLAAPGGEAPAEVAVERLLGWMDDARGQPLFAWLHLFDAHAPYEPPAVALDEYREELERVSGESLDGTLPSPERERHRVEYRAEISWVDRQLARLLEPPRMRDALIGVTADHGECLGANDIWFTHVELFGDTLHVPLLLAGPGVPGGRVGERVSHLDLGRTLLDLAGLDAAPFPGRSLLGRLPPAGAGARPIPVGRPLFALAYAARSASITEGDLHLVLYLHEHEIGTPQPRRRVERHQCELYDLAADPSCERDLAHERPEDARRLRAALFAWLAASRPTGWQRQGEIDEREADLLAAMGYSDPGDTDEQAPWGETDCGCERCQSWR